MIARPFIWIYALLLAGLFAGCHTPKGPAADALASVMIVGRTPTAIRATVGQVFRAHDYTVTKTNEFQAVFEKQGSTMNTLAHGSWSFEPMWIRVKVVIQSLGLSRYLLRCDAYLVNDHGDLVMEEETKIKKLHRGTYQNLLDEVQAKLEVQPAGATPPP